MNTMLSRRIPFILAPGVPQPFTAHGEKIWVENATARFELEVDDGNSATVRAGFESPDLRRFSKVVLTNKGASEIRGVLWVGAKGVRFAYPQQPPVILVPHTITVPSGFNAGTEVLGGYATAAAPYSTYGVESGARRAFALVSNKDNTNDIILYHPNGSPWDVVPKNSSHMIPCDAAFTGGGIGSSVDLYIGEFFYA